MDVNNRDLDQTIRTALTFTDADSERYALAALDALLAELQRAEADKHELEIKLTGYDEFKAARTEAAPDKDSIWEFYDRKLWASILRWKKRALDAEAELQRTREALEQIAENAEAWHGVPRDRTADNGHQGHAAALVVIAGVARAALVAVDEEESVPPHSFGEQGIRPEPNHSWPVAVDGEDQ